MLLLAELVLDTRIELRHSKIEIVHPETEVPLLKETLDKIQRKKTKNGTL